MPYFNTTQACVLSILDRGVGDPLRQRVVSEQMDGRRGMRTTKYWEECFHCPRKAIVIVCRDEMRAMRSWARVVGD